MKTFLSYMHINSVEKCFRQVTTLEKHKTYLSFFPARRVDAPVHVLEAVVISVA